MENRSFSDLSSQLVFCDKLLLDHQVSLMHKKYEQALSQFEQLYEIRTTHLQIMEEKLLPLYESLHLEYPKGGRPLYFIREKRLILKELNRQVRLLGQFILHPEQITLDLVNLFEEYAWLKDLLDHHDAREKGFLFPSIDKELSKEFKQNLFSEISKIYSKFHVQE